MHEINITLKDEHLELRIYIGISAKSHNAPYNDDKREQNHGQFAHIPMFSLALKPKKYYNKMYCKNIESTEKRIKL